MDLPSLAWVEIALKLGFDDVTKLCQTNAQLGDIICQNEFFWQERYLQDFTPPEDTPSSWKDRYYEMRGQAWGFGGGADIIGLGFESEYEDLPQPIFMTTAIQAVSGGSFHSLFLDIDSRVWAAGWNDAGQIGVNPELDADEYIINYSSPHLVPQLSDIRMISAGFKHSLCLSKHGQVWGFGLNDVGQLGLIGEEIHEPTIIPHLPLISKISAGDHHALCLDQNGGVWSFGLNKYGQLGLGFVSEEERIPQRIPGLPPIQSISAGAIHSLALDYEGHVWSFGNNVDGQLGRDTTDQSISTPTRIPSLENIRMISAGGHSLCINHDGIVYSFGNNIAGQLGLGDSDNRLIPQPILSLPPIRSVYAGFIHSFCIDTEDHLWVFGWNDSGQLGLGKELHAEDQPIPVLLSYLGPVKDVSGRGNHTLVLCSYHLTPYSTIEDYIKMNRIREYHLRDDLLVPSPNVILEFVDLDEISYLGLVRYDEKAEKIYPPVLSSA